MQRENTVDRLIAVLLVPAAMIAGVAVAAAHATPPRAGVTARHANSWMSAKANPKHPWLYVASLSQNVVAIYDLAAFGVPQIGQIRQGLESPFGVVVDRQGTVYVANSYISQKTPGNVTIYPAGATSPSVTLTDGLQSPVGLALDTNGDLYVGNQGSAPSIQVFAAGQMTPYRTITSPLLVHPGPMAFDKNRNLFVVDNRTGVAELAYGAPQLVSLGLVGLTYPSAIAIAPKSGDIYVSDLNLHATLVFAPGKAKATRRMSLDPDFFAIGDVRGATYLFAPYSSRNTIEASRLDARKPFWSMDSVAAPQGAAIKLPGVP
jgi:hypothetical protein